MLRWLWLTAVVLVLDHASKWLAEASLTLHQPVEVIPGFFNWFLAYNTGAAFSFLASAGGWQRWFFVMLASGMSVALLLWLRKLQPQETLLAVALSLVLGGAIGNLIDRVLWGKVVDFIQWHYAGYYWPAFNIADSAIFLGAVLLALDAFGIGRPKHHG